MEQTELSSKETHIGNTQLLSSAVSSILTFAVFFVIIFQVYENKISGGKKHRKGKNGKNWNPAWDNLPSLEVLPRVPSVFPLKIIGMLPRLHPIDTALQRVVKWIKEYGTFVTMDALGETFVLLISGPLIQQVLKSTDINHTYKSPLLYSMMKPFVENGVLVSKGKFWQHERKILLKSQSFQSLKSYVPLLNKHCKRFVSSLEDMFKDGKPHEINNLINASFIKVISEMITGFSDDGSKEYDDYHHDFECWKNCLIKRVLYPWLILDPIWRLHPDAKRLDKAIEGMFDFAKRRMQENRMKREEDAKKGNDGETKPAKFRSILDELIEAGVEDRQIIDEVNTMMFGGHETGATVIHCFCFCMALNPEFQKECQKEIDELFENPLAFRNGELTFDAITSNLKYVERCILETLRLFPPVFAFFRKLESPIVINHNDQEVLVPAGTNVALVPYLLHRNEEHFPDPERFDPDRFLPEESAERHAYSFLPFSAGQRNCLGLKFAMIEMKTIVAYSLRHFIITTTDKMEDIKMLPYVTLTPSKDFSFTFTKRDIKHNTP